MNTNQFSSPTITKTARSTPDQHKAFDLLLIGGL